jgi:ADP-heptose:LPS heptosyltransferase
VPVNGSQAPRILVLRALGLGDFLTGLPALRAVAGAFPTHHRLLAAPSALSPLLDLSGCGFELVPARSLEALPPQLSGIELAVNLHGRGPQSHQALRRIAGGRARLIAFAHSDVAESAGLPVWREEEHEINRWCRLLRQSGIPTCPQDTALRAPVRRMPPTLRATTVIHPGAGSPARQWPINRWAEVARRRYEAGDRIVVTGSRDERLIARAVSGLGGLPPDGVLAGRTDLGDLACVVAEARLVMSGDTGIAHLAAALGTASVTLCGPVPPARWGPRPAGGRHQVLWKGSLGDPHGRNPDPGLLAIGVDEVLAAASAALASASDGRGEQGAPQPATAGASR